MMTMLGSAVFSKECAAVAEKSSAPRAAPQVAVEVTPGSQPGPPQRGRQSVRKARVIMISRSGRIRPGRTRNWWLRQDRSYHGVSAESDQTGQRFLAQWGRR